MLLASIFRILGTPTLESWEDAKSLPSFSGIQFKHFSAMPWESILPDADRVLCLLVQQLVVYNTNDRLSAKDALTMLDSRSLALM